MKPSPRPGKFTVDPLIVTLLPEYLQWSHSGNNVTGTRFISTWTSNTWLNGTSHATITSNHSGYSAILSMPVKNGRVSLSSYPSSDNNIYLGYCESGRTTNSLSKSMYWTADTGNLTVDKINGGTPITSGNISSQTVANATNCLPRNTNSSVLPEFSSYPPYLLGIEAFADGGTVKWKGWESCRVGYASSAGSVSWSNVTGGSNSNTYECNTISLKSTTPFNFYGSGSSTYNQACMYVNSSNGIVFETPTTSPNSIGTVLPFKIMTRGAGWADLYCKNAYANSDEEKFTNTVTEKFIGKSKIIIDQDKNTTTAVIKGDINIQEIKAHKPNSLEFENFKAVKQNDGYVYIYPSDNQHPDKITISDDEINAIGDIFDVSDIYSKTELKCNWRNNNTWRYWGYSKK